MSQSSASALDARLLEAHERRDLAALVGLYTQAAEARHQAEAQAFYLTHAYVFALDAGDARAQGLHARLVALGCEE